jgi:hypothetical protein
MLAIDAAEITSIRLRQGDSGLAALVLVDSRIALSIQDRYVRAATWRSDPSKAHHRAEWA